MSGLLWKLNRLRLMSVAELGTRVQQAAQAKLEQRGFGLAMQPPAPRAIGHGAKLFRELAPQLDGKGAIAAAEQVLAGRWDVFTSKGLELGFPPQWNRDPTTGIVAPLTLGKAINYRDKRIVGNIKTIWEPSRHLELVSLAQAWRLSGERRYLDGFATLLRSWLEQCPYPLGIQWCSSLELAIRLLNWAVCWELFGGEDSPLFEGEAGDRLRRDWLASVYRHCHFITGHWSLHSSANNHLLGELMGLWIASLTWPCWPESARWRDEARRGFEREALLQNGADGVNREQAVYYHHEVADMMLISGLFARAHGSDLSAACWQRLEAMMEFIDALMDRAGRVPMIGDADDAVMLRLAHEPDWCPFRSLLASAAVLFGRADFAAAAGALDAKSAWLLGPSAPPAFAALRGERGAPRRREFRAGGYCVLGRDFGGPREIRLVADSGPLGYLAIAAHGHADALALTLSAGGRELLIDPGTYVYQHTDGWRGHFRGTPAHNTVTVDGQDQSVIAGDFMWLAKAAATLEQVQLDGPRQHWQASHDGYRRLADAVLHRRRVEFDGGGGDGGGASLVVTDRLECKGRHEAQLNWQFAEDVELTADAEGWTARSGGVRLRIACDAAGARAAIFCGSEAPRAGWVSREFGAKRPAPQLRLVVPVNGTTEWRTRFALSFG